MNGACCVDGARCMFVIITSPVNILALTLLNHSHTVVMRKSLSIIKSSVDDKYAALTFP